MRGNHEIYFEGHMVLPQQEQAPVPQEQLGSEQHDIEDEGKEVRKDYGNSE